MDPGKNTQGEKDITDVPVASEHALVSYSSSQDHFHRGSEIERCARDSETGQDGTESEVEMRHKGLLRFSSPLPMYKWVHGGDSSEESTVSVPYISCSSRECSDPYKHLEGQGKECVGCATLLFQAQRKAMKKGFEFTLMVVGESGLGKSTLINTLFLTNLYKDRTVYDAQARIAKTVSIRKKTLGLCENGIKLRLNIVDTPGFGDSLDNTNSWKVAVDYIDQQFEQYRKAEINLKRKYIQDSRVHCCLYFISPNGHGLRLIDIEFMKALHKKVNIVPVLAKADSLTPSEIQYMKTRILEELSRNEISIYDFPECDSDDNEHFKKHIADLKSRIPFAVVGSNTTVELQGRNVRARVYPWGIVEENPAHCDLVYLRSMLVHTHMQDLKDTTEDILYENYRTKVLYQKKERVNHGGNNALKN